MTDIRCRSEDCGFKCLESKNSQVYILCAHFPRALLLTPNCCTKPVCEDGHCLPCSSGDGQKRYDNDGILFSYHATAPGRSHHFASISESRLGCRWISPPPPRSRAGYERNGANFAVVCDVGHRSGGSEWRCKPWRSPSELEALRPQLRRMERKMVA